MDGQSSCNKWQEGELRQAKLVYDTLQQLSFHPSSISTSDAQPYGSQLLMELDRFSQLLKVEASSRTYRRRFTRNYKLLFKDHLTRQYQFSLLQAMVKECPAMYVNLKEYSFSAQVVELSRKPVATLQDLCDRLQFCRPGLQENCKAPPKFEIMRLLKSFDSAWADFECHYIQELMRIEAECRKPLIDASRHAERIFLRSEDGGYESWYARLEKCTRQQKILFERLAELNVMANVIRKEREDLNEDALKTAMDVLTSRNGFAESSLLVRSFSEDLVDSFAVMCEYLCSIGRNMETVDPILPNNAVLVERLSDLEESWELFACYVEDEAMRRAVDMSFNTLLDTQASEPLFQEMCSDCDAELFLVIPRIVLLAYFLDGTNDALVKRFLPQIFDGSRSLELTISTSNFENLLSKNPEYAEILKHQAVHGLGTKPDNKAILEEHLDSINNFTRELEGLSMELQRNQAREWNAFCALLLRHLSPEYEKDRKTISNI